jgi:hypothetical protein
MSDKKIPGPVYLVVGAAMILMSVFIDPEKLLLFILFGAVLLVVGFIKILLREKKKVVHHQVHHAVEGPVQGVHPSQHTTAAAHHAVHPQQSHTHSEHQSTHSTTTMRCASCGVKLHPLFKFCPNCGQKLK